MTILEPPKFHTDKSGFVHWRNPPEGHFVYIVESASGPVKVGHAKNPSDRLKNLQTGCPHRLRLKRAFFLPDKELARNVEAAAHVRFAFHAMSGEWFGLPARAAEIGVALEIKNLGYQFCTLEELEKHRRDARWTVEQMMEAERQEKDVA